MIINTNEQVYEDIGLINKKFQAIPLVGVYAQASIIGKNSKVKITQKFKNSNKKAVEAIYRFPLPENATVTGFAMVLEDRKIKGIIEEKSQAFDIYDKALESGNGAVLLDQERPNIFTLSVGNLNPQGEVSIEIEYICNLDFKNGTLRFFLPTTISPRYVPQNMPDEEGIPVKDKIYPEYARDVSYGLNIKVDILKSPAMELASISSPSHKIKTNLEGNVYSIEFTSQDVKMDRDFILEAQYKKNSQNAVFYLKGQDEGFLQVDFTPDLKSLLNDGSGDANNVKRDTVFVLDCSGSMQGSSIAQAKKALEILIKALKPGQAFNIYRFGSRFDRLSESFLEFDQDTLNNTLAFLQKTGATFGGTEILAPLRDIISGGANMTENIENNYMPTTKENISAVTNIVLITDGQVGNEYEVLSLVKSNRHHFRVFTVGIGYGPNEYFIKNLASFTGGDYIMVHPEERTDLKMLALFKNLNMGALQNLVIDAKTGPYSLEQVPASISFFDGINYSLYARINGDALPENIALKGDFNGRQVLWQMPDAVIAPALDKDSGAGAAFMAQFWAWEKIRELESSSFNISGSKQAARKNKKADEQVITLSKKYRILCGSTSFVSVEERTDEKKTKTDTELVKVPTLITHGWHGRERNMLFSSSFEAADTKHVYEMIAPEMYLNESLYESKKSSKDAAGVLLKNKAAGKKGIKDDMLVEILACQRAQGGFEISDNLAKLAKFDMDEINKLAGTIESRKTEMASAAKKSLFETSLIIAILKQLFKEYSDMWGSIINKSISWLDEMNAKHGPEIEGRALDSFVSAYVSKIKIHA
ncbi:MAG: VWA domain-containing protein [Actinobacteria bacterium]|nr:VWA domain-containing protein [Actinomycetota bacterium]